MLKLTVIKIYPINTYSRCRVLNMKMEDSSGVVHVSAFNSLSDRMNKIFKVFITYGYEIKVDKILNYRNY